VTTPAIQPDRILSELADLWVSLGEQHGDESAGVLRACAMTLIVLAEASENEGVVGETLAALMRDHPSRAIVVRVRDSQDPGLDARVFAQCWMPFGQRRQICCEQIEIAASTGSINDVPGVVLALVAADLPIIVWSRLPKLLDQQVLMELARFATKTILDSASFPAPHAALGRFVSAIDSKLLVADLAWTRLTRWRELIAQIFENPAYSEHLSSISAVTIHYAGETPPVSVRYMDAWLRLCLEKTGAQPHFSWKACSEASDSGLCSIEFASTNEPALRVFVRKVDGSTAETQVNTLVNRTVFPQVSDYELLREELSITGRDPIYEASLRQAAKQEPSA
jgi:glucose-6-phosphate dehydrogenase assembly protein OpcA